MTGKCNGFGILTQVWCSIKLFEYSVKVGGSSKGRTSDSGSDCEGSNPSPPATFSSFAKSLSCSEHDEGEIFVLSIEALF